MTAYADVPTVTTLHSECEKVEAALAMLGAGGTMIQFTVGPAPVVPPDIPTGPQVPIAIVTPDGSVSAALVADLTAWLTTRQSDLMAQMGALGVTGGSAAA